MAKAVRLPFSFSTLKSGIEFENLCADLLEAQGFQIEKAGGIGPDSGCDLIVVETRRSLTGYIEHIRWLVQCKHRSDPGTAISPRDIGNITNIVASHNVNGYFLITDAYLTAGAVNQINGVAQNPLTRIYVVYWDYRILCNHLLTHRHIIEKYLPCLLESRKIEVTVSNPFMGLNSYDREHFNLFFGRDTEVHQLLEEIYRNRQILLFGPSGCGKTSLINAGITNIIEKEGVLITAVRLLDSPVSRLVESVQECGMEVGLWNRSESMLKQNRESLCDDFRRRSEKIERKFLFILDQFEEIFLYANNTQQDEIARMIQALTLDTESIGWPRLLISIREDFMGELRN